MFFGPPHTKAEYYRRSIMVPWIVAGVIGVIALGVIAVNLFLRSPPELRGRNTEMDTRYIYAGVAAVFAIGFCVWAPVTTNRWRVLSQRGRLTGVKKVSLSPVVKSGTRPARITYVVDGQEQVIASDLPESMAEAIGNDPNGARVIFDPQNPGRAEVLSPDIARLPDA
jgi:hypothetical protein